MSDRTAPRQHRATLLLELDRQIDALRALAGMRTVERMVGQPLVELRSVPLKVAGKRVERTQTLEVTGDTVSGRVGRGRSVLAFVVQSGQERTVEYPNWQFTQPHAAWIDTREVVGERALVTRRNLGLAAIHASLATTTNRGVAWHRLALDPQIQVDRIWQDPRSGVIDAFAHTLQGAQVYRISPNQLPEVVQGRLPAPAQLREVASTDEWNLVQCTSDDVTWTAGSRRVYRIRGSDADALAVSVQPRSVACDRDRLLVTAITGELQICTRRGCEPASIPPHAASATTIIDGAWVHAALLDGVVGVWREHSSPVFYRFAEGGGFVGVVDLGTATQLVIDSPRGIRLVTLSSTVRT